MCKYVERGGVSRYRMSAICSALIYLFYFFDRFFPRGPYDVIKNPFLFSIFVIGFFVSILITSDDV